jgi:hypothetical protein
MSKADVGLWKFPSNAMECWVSSQSSQTLPDLPGYNTEYNQSRIFRMAHMDVYVSIYIYGFSYGLQCPISFGDITNGRGNKQVSIDAGI